MSGVPERPDWYRQWFGREYLALYPHRDAEEAHDAVELVLRVCGRPHGPILDLACGPGRHLLEFQARGLHAIGLDLSATLLREARRAGASLPLVRGDMRDLPFTDAAFALVANFFTSFGYFSDPEDDARVLADIRRILRPGGAFALDFLNATRVRRNLVERDERPLHRKRVVQERHLEESGRVVAKTIRIFGPDHDRPLETFVERVRLYDPPQLRAMLERTGFETEHMYGNYQGAPLEPDSPRCILLGRAL